MRLPCGLLAESVEKGFRMEQLAEVERLVDELARFGLLQPALQAERTPHDRRQIAKRVFGAFPTRLPRARCLQERG